MHSLCRYELIDTLSYFTEIPQMKYGELTPIHKEIWGLLAPTRRLFELENKS